MKFRAETQISAGGVTFRHRGGAAEVALISVGEPPRWQLPKGTVEPGESNEQTAVREVREETGLDAQILEPLDTIEYWYQGHTDGVRVRYHKFVHFFLLLYESGDVADHDGEVNEARWVPVASAVAMLAYVNERRVLERACARIATYAAR